MDAPNPAAEYLRLSERYREMKDEELLALVPQSDKLTPFAQQALASEIRQRGLKVEAVEEKSANAADDPTARANPKFNLKFNPSFNPKRNPKFNPPVPKFRKEAEYSSVGAELSNADLSPDEAPGETEEDPYEEDRKLFTLCTVWSLRDALKVQRILDVASIPFYMGPEKATGVDQVRSDFSKGVGVQIMQIGWPWAYQAMRDQYFPEDDDGPWERVSEPKPLVVRCPQCQSTEVIFSGLSPVVGVPAENSPQKFRWTCDACGNRWEDEGLGREE